MTNVNPPAGWHPDPTGQHPLRYWDGVQWTDHVSGGAQPTPQGYGYAMPSAGAVKSLRGVATALSALLVVTALAAIAFAAALFNRVSVLDDLSSFSIEEAVDADDAVAGTAGLFILTFLVTAVLWIVWQHRHAKNARLLGQHDGLGPGWAIGGWFIPIANYIVPQLQLMQAAKASDPEGRQRVPPVFVVWWILFALGSVGGLANGGAGDADVNGFGDIEDFQQQDRIAAFSMVLLVATAVAAIATVRTLSTRQHEALARRGFGS